MLLTAVVDAHICTADGVLQSVTNSQLDSSKTVPVCIREANWIPCFTFAEMYIMLCSEAVALLGGHPGVAD